LSGTKKQSSRFDLRSAGKLFKDAKIQAALDNLTLIGGNSIAIVAKRGLERLDLIVARKEHKLLNKGKPYHKAWLKSTRRETRRKPIACSSGKQQILSVVVAEHKRVNRFGPESAQRLLKIPLSLV